MRYKFANILLFIAAFLVAGSSLAADLMDVYKDAAISDTIYKNAYANYLEQRESLPLSQAAILPQIGLMGNLNRHYNDLDGTVSGDPTPPRKFYDNEVSYGLSITQPIFNLSSWAEVASASSLVKKAQAEVSFAAQDLILRVASTYFNVLKAQDVLSFTNAEKKAIKKQLVQARAQYKVGLIPITNYYEAQARFDQVKAEEIAAQNALSDQWENLRVITGVRYPELAEVSKKMPLVSPAPSNIDSWVAVAKRQNYQLQAAHYGELAAKRNVFAKGANHAPTINIDGNYGYSYHDNPYGLGADNHSRGKVATLGLTATLPIFSGGAITAETRQARAQYDSATSLFEQAHRETINQTRQAYLGVMSLISRIKADRQAIVSQRSALKTTNASYKVGMRTMADVLQSEANLYQIEKTYAQDQYDYLLQTLALKQAAGTLSVNDLDKINSWLSEKVVMPKRVNSKANQIKHKQVVKPKTPSQKIKARKAIPTKQLPNDEKYLEKADPNHYTVRFYTASNKETLQNLVNKYQLKATQAVPLTQIALSDKPLWMLVHGDYVSQKSAKQAANYWQKALPKAKIKVLKFASLQAIL